MTSNHHGPYALGHTRYNGRYNGQPRRKPERILKSRSQLGLGAETRPHEHGIASNRGSATPR